MEKRYVVTSKKFDEVPGLGLKVHWVDIPEDHFDSNIKRYHPGKMFFDRSRGVVFIFPERRR